MLSSSTIRAGLSFYIAFRNRWSSNDSRMRRTDCKKEKQKMADDQIASDWWVITASKFFSCKWNLHQMLFNPLLHMLPIGNMWFQLKLKINSCNRGYRKIEIFLGSRISKFLRPGAALWQYLSSLKKPSKTAVVLIAGVKFNLSS